MRRHHGQMNHRGMTEEAVRNGHVCSKRFFTQFPELTGYSRSNAFLTALGDADGPMRDADAAVGDADIPAGFGIFGQFIDHDITFDPTSSLEQQNDPNAVRNFRTPRLDLDSLYGSGPEVTPYLYDHRDDAKLLLGKHDAETSPADDSAPPAARFDSYDLVRSGETALTGDPRNDENDIIAQLHLTFAKFHNRVVDYLRSGKGRELWDGEPKPHDNEALLHEAQRVVRWHYQWIVLNEFLPLICDNSVLDDIEVRGRRYFLTRKEGDISPAIPVEFAGAAYRYGHSQIRNEYTVNDSSGTVRFFPDPDGPVSEMMDGGTSDAPSRAAETATETSSEESPELQQALSGFGPVDRSHVVDWRYLFDFAPNRESDGQAPQHCRKIDPQLPSSLLQLPFAGEGGFRSLAALNLRRGKVLGLPSGQAIAERMGVDPLANDDLPLTEQETLHDYLRTEHRGADAETPLWLYVLAEASAQQGGNRLGAVGSRIVAETLTALVELDESSYKSANREWHPRLPRTVSSDGEWDEGADDETHEPYYLADLLAFATGPVPDGLAIEAIDDDGSGPAPAVDDDATGGEAVILSHEGKSELSLEGYEIDFDDDQTKEFGTLTMEPSDTLVVYTGAVAPDSEEYDTIALGFTSPVINNRGDTVVVRTPTREVSAYRETDAPE